MGNWLNRDLLPIKAHYFLFNAGSAPVVSFMTVYAKQLGFSSVVVGTIYAILPFVGMFSKLFIGALADRLRMRKALFIGFLVLAVISFFGVQFVPSVTTVTKNKVSLDCSIETNVKICSTLTKKQCIAEHLSSNNTIQCFFNCDLTQELITELCTKWGIESLCSWSLPPPATTNALPHDDNNGKTTYPAYRPYPKLNFTADVPLIHTVQLESCVFMRVKNAVLTDQSVHIPHCHALTKTQCDMICTDAGVNDLLRNATSVESNVLGLYQFWILFWLLVLSWMGMAVVVSLTDTICFELLGDHPNLFGKQRVWGAIGWGIFAVLSGVLVDYYSDGSLEKNYTPAFYLLLILWTIDIVFSYTLKYEQKMVSLNIWTDVGRLLRSPSILIFMLSCIVMGMCTGLQWNFLYWYLEELATTQGCGSVVRIKTLQGLVSGVQCFLGELPYFFISGYVLQKLGHIHCMSLILFFVAVRLLLYSALTDPWWTLPIELFQGVFGLFYPTMASYANAVAPPGTEATVQGMVGAIFEGAGVALGSFLAGISYETYRGAVTFRIFGTGALLACILHVGVHFVLSKKQTRYSPNGFTGLTGSGTEAVAMLEQT